MKILKFYLIILISFFLSNCDESEMEYSLNCCGDIEKKIICLVASEDSVIADGISTVTLRACIPNIADSEITTVKFEAPEDAGSFVSEGGTNQVTKSFDLTRTATAVFTSGRKKGTYTITATVEADGKSYTDEINLVETVIQGDIIILNEDEALAGMVADSHSVYNWHVLIEGIDIEGKSIDITRTGPFKFSHDPSENEISLPLDEQGRVSFSMNSTRVAGQAELHFTLDNFTLSKHYDIFRAYPNEINIIPGDQTIKPENDSIHLDIFMIRDPGYVSAGIDLSLRAFQVFNDDTIDVGEFIPPFPVTVINEVNSPNGSVLFRLFPDYELDTLQPLIISCSIVTENGVSVVGNKAIPVVE
ncbi:MAG: hypothetical protein DWQ02_26725 [Bacteroidetes bacterium]|nr:MAG: hypothetical protein DWQ02_26725 [Bacteroidota bacterium]